MFNRSTFVVTCKIFDCYFGFFVSEFWVFLTSLLVAFHLLIRKIFIEHLCWDSTLLNSGDDNEKAKAMLSRAYILLYRDKQIYPWYVADIMSDTDNALEKNTESQEEREERGELGKSSFS